ncbi:ATP-binding protein [uncultured Desulfobacter sp.]|uniref:ATP-binding protein n=1 Tax=uncultured Desulfobacter sp. TaxID=240139 RepID=UPI002AA6BDFE|nr:ATP-binding protein [uncultured Desulfobacter sp.]
MGLRTHIIVVAVLAFSAVNLFLCLFFTHQVKVHEIEKFQAQIDKSAYLMRIINTLPLYNVDMESLTKNMETFFDDENIKSLNIHDSEVNININLERQLFSGGTDIKKSFVLEYKGLKLGRLTVVYSTGLIEKKIAEFQIRMLGVTVVVTLGIALLFAFLINTIIKPVVGLARIISESTIENFDNEIEKTGGVGEVGILSRSFVRMHDLIKEKKEVLAHTNKLLESEIQQKDIQQKKIKHQDKLICAVKTFFQQTMAAQSIHEIAKIFISIAQGVLSSPHCFVGQICDTEDNLKIMALSDEMKKLCPGFDSVEINPGLKLHISGRLLQAITNKAPVIFNSADLNSEISFWSKEHLPMATIMALPLLQGKDVFGLAIVAGKEGGYTAQDQEIATMMVMVLVQALRLRRRQDETDRLEKMMIRSEKKGAMGMLAASMADEISEPLVGICKAVQMIRNRVEKPSPETLAVADKNGLSFDRLSRYMKDQDVISNLNLIDEAGKKASMIASTMRFYSGNTNMGLADEALSLLLDEALVLASKKYSLKQDFHFDSIQIMTDYAPDLPKIRCRGGELKLVFLNILSNGVYAMAGHIDNPCPTFFIRTYAREDQVCVEIRDNGPGIPKNIRKRIFKPFFSTNPDNEGGGLGLSVAYFIVTENHKGTIEVESTPGEGTCFRIFLPI